MVSNVSDSDFIPLTTVMIEINFMNHLQWIWCGAGNKYMSTIFNIGLKEELDEIKKYPIRACDTEFSDCANYEKGHG